MDQQVQQAADKQLMDYIHNGKVTEAINMLQTSNLLINITSIKDYKEYTLIHKATLLGDLELVKCLVQKAKEYLNRLSNNQQDVNNLLVNWIDAITDEGYTAVHFACFRGYLPFLEYFSELGADFAKVNKQGLSAVHIAAQGDQPISLTYCSIKNLDMLQRDSKGGTPLHWAAFIGSENAVNFLCAWSKQEYLDIRDNEGLTPLHLSVLSSNSRIVRKLLVRGADRNIKDNNNKLPISIAKETNNNNIQELLQLKKGIVEYCNIRPSYQKIRKKKRQVLVFLILFVFGSSLTVFLNLPCMKDDWMIYWTSALFFLSYLLYIIVVVRDPGYIIQRDQSGAIQRKTKQGLLDLLKSTNKVADVCPDCHIKKPERSRHCEICQHCTAVYDHHCPWVNNCIGTKNHIFFFAFILVVWMALAQTIYINMFHLVHDFSNSCKFQWYKNILDEHGYVMYLRLVIYILLESLCFLFFIPLTILIVIQFKNLLLNKTTYERFSQNKKSVASSSLQNSTVLQSHEQNQQSNVNSESIHKKQDNNLSFNNCYIMCFSNCRNPKYTNHYTSSKSNLYEALN